MTPTRINREVSFQVYDPEHVPGETGIIMLTGSRKRAEVRKHERIKEGNKAKINKVIKDAHGVSVYPIKD